MQPLLGVMRRLIRTIAVGSTLVAVCIPIRHAFAQNLSEWVNQHVPTAVIGATTRAQCDRVRQQWASLRKELQEQHQRCIDSYQCKETLGKGRQCKCSSCEEVHQLIFEQPVFWRQADGQFNACLASVKEYEVGQQQQARRKRDAEFREYQRRNSERMLRDQVSREQRRQQEEHQTQAAKRQQEIEQIKKEQGLAFANYERRLRGLPEQQREPSTMEKLYLHGKEAKEAKDDIAEILELYDLAKEGPKLTFKNAGKAFGNGALGMFSPGLPPYEEAGKPFVDDDPVRAKAIYDEFQKENKERERELQRQKEHLREMERQYKTSNPNWFLVPQPAAEIKPMP